MAGLARGRLIVGDSSGINRGTVSAQSLKKTNITVADVFKSESIIEALVYNYYDFINFVLRWCIVFLLISIVLIFISLPLISYGTRVVPQSPLSPSPLLSPVAYAYDKEKGGPLTPLLDVSHEGNIFHQEMYAATEAAERYGRSHSERTKAELTRNTRDPMS